MRKYLFVVLSFMLLGVVGCSGIGNKVDKESLGSMKRVALIGLTVDEREPASGSAFARGLLGMEDGESFMGGKLSFVINTSPHVDAAYDIASKTIADQLKLEFIPRILVASNVEVKKLYGKKTATVQTGVSPLKPYYQRFEAQGVPQFYYVHWADKAFLNQVAKSLKVDGLVIVQSQTDLSGTIIGKISSKAYVNIMFYDPKLSEFTTYVNQGGDEVSTKENKIMGFADSNEMHIQSLEAMKVTLGQIVSKFQ